MAAAEEVRLAPTYDLEGLPLVYPIYFEPEQLSLRGCLHHGVHPARLPIIQDEVGRALRLSRCYWSPDTYHRSFDIEEKSSNPGSYHHFIGERHKHFAGPEIPQEESKKAIISGLYLSGVVPREALDFRAKDPDFFAITALGDKQYEFLASPLVTTIDHGLDERRLPHVRNAIGNYLTRYALRQEVGDLVSKQEWKTFLRPKGEATVREIGNLVIYRSVEEIAQSVMPYYRLAQERGMVASSGSDPRSILKELVPRHKFGEYYQQLREVAELTLAA